jgi:hypothetical protein
MRNVAVVLLCVWALLEPPYKGDMPILDAPFKEWTVASYKRGSKLSIPYYFDTRSDCEQRRKELTYSADKVCLPVNPALTPTR